MSSNTGAFVPPPSGPLPTDSRGPVVVGTAAMCMLIGTSAVALRLYTRFCLVHKVGIDDGMAVMSVVSMIALGIGQMMNVSSGLGSHAYTLDLPAALVPFLKDFWLCLLTYNIAHFFIKMTFLFQYYRVVAQVQKLRIIYLVAMVLIGSWAVGQVIVISLLCTPIEGFWDKSLPAKCINSEAENEVNVVGNIVTDFVILALPLPVLLRLNLRPTQKWALVGVFSLGFFTCIISIIRRVLGLMFTPDVFYSSVDITCWSIGEVASGITCAALPTFKPFLSRYFPSLKSKVQKYAAHHKSSHYRSSTQGSKIPTGNYFTGDGAARPYSKQADVKSDMMWHDRDDDGMELDSRNGRRVMIDRKPRDEEEGEALSVRRPGSMKPLPPLVESPQDSTFSAGPPGTMDTTTTTTVARGGQVAISRPGSAVPSLSTRSTAGRVKRDVGTASLHDAPSSREFI